MKKDKNTLPIKEVTEADAWPAPDMSIVTDNRHPAPEFPLDMLGAWAEWIADAAESKSAPVDYVALALLGATSSLISNVRQGMLKKGWAEPTILWGMLVGNPSSNKSPALDIIREPLRLIESELAEDYRDLSKEHDTKVAAAHLYHEKWEKDCRQAIKGDLPTPAMPDAAREPDAPPRPRLMLNDTTIEAAAVVMLANPRGLCLCRDEMAGLLANFERHGGSDREFWLEGYGGRSYQVDRKKDPKPCIIPRLSVALLGTIQPEKLSVLLTETIDDGFAARLLYASPNPVPFSKSEVVADSTKLLRAFRKLRALPLDKGEPVVVPFAQNAKDMVLDWCANLRKKEEKEAGVMVSFLGKMPGTVIRLAVVLAYLDWAATDKNSEPEKIALVHAERAMALVKDYFIPMGRRTLAEYAVPERQSDARLIAKWILRCERCNINLRHIKRIRVLPTHDAARYDAAIQFLEKCDWIVPLDPKKLAQDRARERNDGVARGRRPKTYRVNPNVFDM